MASPRIDTSFLLKGGKENRDHQQQDILSPSSFNSPSSANSLMMEHSGEGSTVKDWLRRVKSERDRLRRDKTSLQQQLTAERQGRNQWKAELDGHKNRVASLEDALMKEKSTSPNNLEEAGQEDVLQLTSSEVDKLQDTMQKQLDEQQDFLQKQLEDYKNKVASLEDELAKEKSTSALREMQMLKEELERLKAERAELEQQNDLPMEANAQTACDADAKDLQIAAAERQELESKLK
jgi:chromosome segregation ATPase